MRTKHKIKLLKYFQAHHGVTSGPSGKVSRDDWFPSTGIWQSYSLREEVRNGQFYRFITLICVAPFGGPFEYGDKKELYKDQIVRLFDQVEFVFGNVEERIKKDEIFKLLIEAHRIDLKKCLSSDEEWNKVLRELKICSITG